MFKLTHITYSTFKHSLGNNLLKSKKIHREDRNLYLAQELCQDEPSSWDDIFLFCYLWVLRHPTNSAAFQSAVWKSCRSARHPRPAVAFPRSFSRATRPPETSGMSRCPKILMIRNIRYIRDVYNLAFSKHTQGENVPLGVHAAIIAAILNRFYKIWVSIL